MEAHLLWGCHMHQQRAALCSCAAAAAWDPEATAPAAAASCPKAAGALLMQRQLHVGFDYFGSRRCTKKCTRHDRGWKNDTPHAHAVLKKFWKQQLSNWLGIKAGKRKDVMPTKPYAWKCKFK